MRDSASIMTLSREDTAAAYARHKAFHDTRRWADLADLFRGDGVYEEPFFGRIEGQGAIRDFLERSMRGLDDWEFPFEWIVVDTNRVVTRWFNLLPQRRRDGSPFQFAGISIILYDDEGLIVSQEDMYDRVEAVRVLTEAKSPLVERFNGSLVRLGAPLVDLAKRLSGFG